MASPAPRSVYANDKVVSVALPPTLWLIFLAETMVAHQESGAALERPLVLTWWAMLRAAEQSPAGFDQEVAGARDDLEHLMRESTQPPLNVEELATLACIVHVHDQGEKLFPCPRA